MTQACHASVAAIWAYKDKEASVEYLADENIQRMTKVMVEVRKWLIFCIINLDTIGWCLYLSSKKVYSFYLFQKHMHVYIYYFIYIYIDP